jgi:hypothetical protein
LLFASPAGVLCQAEALTHLVATDQAYLIICSDDGGTSRSGNMSLERLIAIGDSVSVSVM